MVGLLRRFIRQPLPQDTSKFLNGKGDWAIPPVGSGAWVLLQHSAPSGVATVDFTGLAGNSEIFVFLYLITLGASEFRQIRVSIDNGGTFLTSSGDYQQIDPTGTIGANLTSMSFHDTASAAARTCYRQISFFNQVSPKMAWNQPQSGSPLNIIPTPNALNAIRILTSGGSNFTGGDIYVFGR